MWPIPSKIVKQESTFWRSFNSPTEFPTDIPRLDLSFPDRSADWGILMLRSSLIPSEVDTLWLSAWSIQWLHSKKYLSKNKIFNKVLYPRWSPVSSTELCSPQQRFSSLMPGLLSWYHPQHGRALSFPEITVLPWSSPSMSDLLQKLQCRSDLL